MNETIESTNTTTIAGNCEKHGEYEAQAVQIGRRTLGGKCPQCVKIAHDEAEQAAHQKEADEKRHKVELLIRGAALPLRFQDRGFDNFSAETDAQKRVAKVCRRYADNFQRVADQGSSLLFCGPPGTGKTHLAAAIARTIAEAGYQPLFASVLRAVRTVKETYRRGSELTEQEAINRFLHPDLLILDEVGVQFGSDAESLILFEILNGRYENLRPSILISNLDAAGVGNYLGERVMDRLQEGGGMTLAFDWDSYRRREAVK